MIAYCLPNVLLHIKLICGMALKYAAVSGNPLLFKRYEITVLKLLCYLYNRFLILALAAVEATRKRPTIVTEASVLDTLATLATASTQMATSGSETSLQAQKVASLPSTAVAPSYISIPGVQGPVQIVHAGANQPGFIHPGSLASGLPAGMIQLASPLAFNFVPGGRFQVIFRWKFYLFSCCC